MSELRRHWRLWVRPDAWAAILAESPDLAGEPFVADWAHNDWPLIACRPPHGAPQNKIAAGLALPPEAGKKRLSLLLPPDAIAKQAPPSSLSDAVAAAPFAWQSCIADLLREVPDMGVFGSLSWQFATGLTYLSPSSDLDLLIAHKDQAALPRIAAIAADAPMRIDGELIRDDGAGVQWRELFDGAGEVLVKRMDGVVSMTPAEFLA